MAPGARDLANLRNIESSHTAPPHPSGYPDAHLHDTASHEWRDICLARWICRLPDADARAQWLEKIKARHGAIVAGTFDDLVRAQWKARSEWAPAWRAAQVRVQAAATEPELFEVA